MATKKVPIGEKPTRQRDITAMDAWVSQAAESQSVTEQEQPKAEPMKCLTIDVPASLHSRIKVQCAQGGQKMADVIRAMLEEKFPDLS